MYCIKQLSIVIVLVGLYVQGQTSDFIISGDTGFAVNHKVSQDYQVNFRLGTRYFLYRDEDLDVEARQIDFAHFSTYNITFNHSLSLGVQYRQRDLIDGGNDELRLTQQFNYTKKHFSKRFGHRVRLEERIIEETVTWRSRYRFALDIPLKGEKVDLGESYFVTSMELLWSLNSLEKPKFDHRTTAQIGWQISKNMKLQGGLEWRFEEFNSDNNQRLFVLTSAILKI